MGGDGDMQTSRLMCRTEMSSHGVHEERIGSYSIDGMEHCSGLGEGCEERKNLSFDQSDWPGTSGHRINVC